LYFSPSRRLTKRSAGCGQHWYCTDHLVPLTTGLVCMISSQLRHEVTGVDEVVREADPDFADTGLKTTSVIRVTRIAVVSADILHGTIGKLNEERLTRIRTRVANWILGASGTSDDEEATKAEQANPRDKK
jgi:mRNA interferase MazF